ncbi:MAG: hypothetical protein F4X72_00825 [Dehalococcoidia bacterium]|nr:hypothetical protein [Dehalococcoidia bacterium]
MTSRKQKADNHPPDLKWVVEYLVQREGQRKTAALLGVNRKTVALALSRERLTGRMALAVQRFMAGLDDPDGENTNPIDRLEARIQVALEVAHELAGMVESLTQRVEALEAAQLEDDAVGRASDAPDAEGRGLRLFDRWRRRRVQAEEGSDG